MTACSPLWLKLKFERLVKACGGLEEASAACAELARPYSVSQLQRCYAPGDPNHAPMDIVAALEAYCGQPIVSRAMIEARPSAPMPGDLLEEACSATVMVAALQGHVIAAMADGHADAAERRALRHQTASIREQLRLLDAALDAEGGA